MTEQATQRDQHETFPDAAYITEPPAAEPRTAHIRRSTQESNVEVELNLDGRGDSQVSTGVRFYDHMLASLAKHALFDLTVQASGDTLATPT